MRSVAKSRSTRNATHVDARSARDGDGHAKRLPETLRGSFEAAHGVDFSRVRVREGTHVARNGALAYTRGDVIHFAPGVYRPDHPQGRKVIAHELAHVIQQRQGRVRFEDDLAPVADLEREADQSAIDVTAGTSGRRLPAEVGVTPREAISAGAAAPRQALMFRMDERGKVHYLADTQWNRWFRPPDSQVMNDASFASWKGAGKRHGSNKVTDPATGTHYVLENGQFHHYDKQKPSGAGALVSNSSWFGETQQQALHRRMNAGQLVDRRRGDRTQGTLQPFDVGPYASPVTLGHRTHQPLPKAQGAWPANNDHIVSGESIRRRSPPDQAVANYNVGAAIAIDNPGMHQGLSPTYGGRQQTKDSDQHGTDTRVNMDAAHPARAYTRDVFTMLDKTRNQNYSQSAPHFAAQPTLDLTHPTNRVRQMGAYRTQYRMNVRLNQMNPARGIDPSQVGENYAEVPVAGNVGSFHYAPAGQGVQQGHVITHNFLHRLRQEGFVG